MSHFFKISKRFLLLLAFLLAASTAHAERPTAPQLLPKSTALIFRIADTPEFSKKFMTTAIGRMSQDPQLKPLLDELYGEGVKAFDIVEQEIGVSLPELLTISQGELTVAMVAPENELPAAVLLLDTGDKTEVAETLIDKATKMMDDAGLPRNEETVDETKVVSYPTPTLGAGEAVFFQRDNTVVVCTRLKLAKQILQRWNGVENTDDQLAKNARYAAIMQKCHRSKKNPPQMTFFVDPIALIESATTGNPFASAAMAVLPEIGLDGFSGVGGSITFDADPFDAITHLHVLLENPRTGALELFALGEGDTKPQNWVPADIASYSTMHWDIKKTYEQIGALVDKFQGEGAFAKQVENNINDQLGIDLEKEIIDGLSGRVTYLNWFERPIKLTSSSNLVAIDLKDPNAMQTTIDKMIKLVPEESVQEVKFGSVTYYKFSFGEEQRPKDRPALVTLPTPCIGILDNVLLLCDRETLFKKVLTASDDPEKSLAGSEDYKLIARRIERIAGKNKPGMVSFNRPEEGMRFLYDLATSAEAKEWIASEGEENPFLSTLKKALNNNPLPPFAVITKYLAPAGGLLVNEPTGFHYTGFTLRRE